MQVPALGFADVAEVAFLAGPPAFQKFSGLFRYKIILSSINKILSFFCHVSLYNYIIFNLFLLIYKIFL
jgi:hypothetical protein